jgi:hypothetical protein
MASKEAARKYLDAFMKHGGPLETGVRSLSTIIAQSTIPVTPVTRKFGVAAAPSTLPHHLEDEPDALSAGPPGRGKFKFSDFRKTIRVLQPNAEQGKISAGIRRASRAGDHEKVIQLMGDAKRGNIQLHTTECISVLTACLHSDTDHTESAMHVFDTLKNQGGAVSNDAYAMVVEVLVKFGQAETALQLIKDFSSNGRPWTTAILGSGIKLASMPQHAKACTAHWVEWKKEVLVKHRSLSMTTLLGHYFKLFVQARENDDLFIVGNEELYMGVMRHLLEASREEMPKAEELMVQLLHELVRDDIMLSVHSQRELLLGTLWRGNNQVLRMVVDLLDNCYNYEFEVGQMRRFLDIATARGDLSLCHHALDLLLRTAHPKKVHELTYLNLIRCSLNQINSQRKDKLPPHQVMSDFVSSAIFAEDAIGPLLSPIDPVPDLAQAYGQGAFYRDEEEVEEFAREAREYAELNGIPFDLNALGSEETASDHTNESGTSADGTAFMGSRADVDDLENTENFDENESLDQREVNHESRASKFVANRMVGTGHAGKEIVDDDLIKEYARRYLAADPVERERLFRTRPEMKPEYRNYLRYYFAKCTRLQREQSERKRESLRLQEELADILCGSVRRIDQFYYMLVDLVRSGYQVPCVAINALIVSAGRTRQLDRAFAAFQEYDTVFGTVPDVHAYNALLKGFSLSTGPKMEALVQLIDRMESAGITPDGESFSYLLDVIAENEDWHSIRPVLEEMMSRNLTPLPRSARRMAIYLAKAGLWDDIDTLEQMKHVAYSLRSQHFVARFRGLKNKMMCENGFDKGPNDRNIEREDHGDHSQGNDNHGDFADDGLGQGEAGVGY